MKYIFFLLVISPFGVKAQSDSCVLNRTVDAYTKEKVISTGFIDLTGALLTIDATKQEVDFFFSVKGNNKCFSDATTATVFFANSKTRMNQRNNGTMNCEGNLHFIFRNTATPPLLLRRLATMPLDRIVIVGNKKEETIITFTPEQQARVMKLAACMVEETPSLLN